MTTLRCAIYSRFSSDHQKETSITDQVRNCEQYAQRQGWTVTHRYEDKAISGTKDAEERPGYKQMLTDAKSGLFTILVIDDLSRLNRDLEDQIRTRKRLTHWGTRIVGVSDGYDTSHKTHKVMGVIKGLQNEMFVDDIKEKIKRGMIGQAERCFWNGGRVYGYKLVPVVDATKTDCYGNPVKIGTRLTIDKDQAKWVRFIFEAYANGRSPRNIVTELNARGVPPPGAVYKYKRLSHRPPTWSAAALHGELERGTGLLNNQLYRGVYRWNRSYRVIDPDAGTETNRWYDQHKWITKEIPELRIVSEDLWERAHSKRVAVSQTVHALNTMRALKTGQDYRSAGPGRRPKYLFSGFLVCSQCGSNMAIYGDPGYACSLWRTGGATAHTCTNSLTVKRTVVESLLLKAIQQDLFTEEGLEVFQQEFEQYLSEHRKAKTAEKTQAHIQLVEVEQVITNIKEAIRQGIITPTTKEILLEAEAKRDHLRQTLRVPTKKLDQPPTALPNIVDRFTHMLDDLVKATRTEIDKARSILFGLVGEKKIVLRPTTDHRGRYYMAELSGQYAGLLPLVSQGFIKLVAVTRIERVTRGL